MKHCDLQVVQGKQEVEVQKKGITMAEEVSNETKETGKSLSMGAWIGIAVATLVVGVLIGYFALGGGAGGSLNKSTVQEAELDKPVASFTYNGQKKDITSREVIEQNGSLDSAKDEEGNYSVPSADMVLQYARNQIIAAEADGKGIEVTDDDLTSYAEEMLGSSDFESIATSYGMDAETVKNLLRSTAKMNKLRDQVIGETDAGEAPEAPKQPEVAKAEGEEGEEADQAAQEAANKEPKKEYADYIIKLAGDEWDSKKGTWKSKDGPFATALAEYEVKADGASYEAANAAYMLAYQNYSTKQSEVADKWTDYVNGLLGNSSISIYTLKS